MIRSMHSLEVTAPLETVWALIIDVTDWPNWQTDVVSATIDGDFEPGTSFSWSSGGLDVASTIEAVEPFRTIRWSGPANGIWGEHSWTLLPQGDHVRISTEETWAGPPVDADPERARQLLDDSLQRWLRLLADEAKVRGT